MLATKGSKPVMPNWSQLVSTTHLHQRQPQLHLPKELELSICIARCLYDVANRAVSVGLTLSPPCVSIMLRDTGRKLSVFLLYVYLALDLRIASWNFTENSMMAGSVVWIHNNTQVWQTDRQTNKAAYYVDCAQGRAIIMSYILLPARRFASAGTRA